MPETPYNRHPVWFPWIAAVTLVTALPGCQLFVNHAEKATTTSPLPEVALPKSGHTTPQQFIPRSEQLTFMVDSSISTGVIDLALDHESLAPRRSVCECPLGGTITATLRTSNTGARTLTIERVELVTAGKGELEFAWSPLIGTIRMVIPSGLLTITDKSPDPVIPLSMDGSFSHPDYRFYVGGTGQLETTGLLLKKQIGNSETDLTIEETEPVTLSGMLTREEGRWHLDLPDTIMRDSFEVDEEGATLNLIFTGNIFSSVK